MGVGVVGGTVYSKALGVGFDGNKSLAQVVHIELIFCRRTFRGQFLLVDQIYGILGRNVLNEVPLLLDGPQLSWNEQQ